MPKFTLIAEHTDAYGKPTGHKITTEFNVDYLNEVLENFDLFIRGVGFIPEGVLEYTPEETYYGLDPDFGDHGGGSIDDGGPSMEEWQKVHSHYFFDTERNK